MVGDVQTLGVAPSSEQETSAMPESSVTLKLTEPVGATAAPAVGAVIDTTGADPSTKKLRETGAELLPTSSVAVTVTVCRPSERLL